MGATIIKRNFFCRRVSIVGAVAISLADLMRSAPAVTGTPAWGTNSDGSKSADSTIADGASLIPVTEELYVGYDAQVAAVDAAATYKGVPATAGQIFSINDFVEGPVDASNVFLYSVNTQDVDIIFTGI
jgi:hypothetical protein